MGRIVATVGFLALLAVPAHALDGSMTGNCPGYVEHLQVARTHLARGDRSRAVAELRDAERALQACLREEEAAGPPRVARCERRNFQG